MKLVGATRSEPEILLPGLAARRRVAGTTRLFDFLRIYELTVVIDPWSTNNTQTRDRNSAARAILGGKAHDTEIARVLAVALAMGADCGLKETLRGLSGAPAGSAFAVSQPNGSGRLTVEVNRVVAGRHRPQGLALVEEHALRALRSSNRPDNG